ncbi:MAG: phosphatidate cytidylyltransferase [Desulfuromonadales bacterium]|nr:phosphatidate cytidylyltransferase [Desulfuromonadales bacterium]
MKLRIITAIIALPLLILLIAKGSVLLFTLFICLLSFLGLIEYYQMALPERRAMSYLIAAAGGILPYFFMNRRWDILVISITFLTLVISTVLLFNFKDIKQVAAEAGIFVFGLIYIPLLLGYLVLCRAGSYGAYWIFLMLCIVMSGDSAAYFIGCKFGKHKLYPVVSPNKSIEGAIGGLVGSLAGAFIFRMLFFPELPVLLCGATAVVAGAFGQIGDLFESLIKRSCGVKDSGKIVPGHGGILDRLDSILFAAPVIWLASVILYFMVHNGV